MAWRKPTEDDIVATISKDELEAYRSSSDWSTDPIEILARRAAAMVRDYLRTNGNIRMSPDEGEIPESTISPAMDYLAIDILKRLDIEPSEARREARRDAVKYFEKIASGVINPGSYGASEDGTTGGPGVETVTSSRLRCNGIEGF